MKIPEEQCCCVTGHRPERLPWKYNEEHPDCVEFKKKMKQHLLYYIEEGYVQFISGMAQGIDLYFAEIVLELKKDYPQILLEAARPCATQAKGWQKSQQDRYETILNQCDTETLIQVAYTSGCMFRRNCYMVERSSVVLAYFDGNTKGGTAQTLRYARKLRRTCVNLYQEKQMSLEDLLQ